MVLKLSLIFFAVYISDIKGVPLGYTYSNAAGGWLKYYKAASWSDASARCDFEGGVIASPVTISIRDAIASYITQQGHGGAWVLTGVQADFQKGDHFSGEGVPLSKMPVMYNFNSSGNSDECVKWKSNSIEVQGVDCNSKLDYVCFKKRDSVDVAGCGTSDIAYAHDARSGSCYKFHRSAQTWSKAYEKCKKEGSSLAVINNELERLVLKELFAKNPSVMITGASLDSFAWVGVRDWMEDGKSWTTMQGQTLSEAGFEVWRSGRPTFVSTMHCVTISRESLYENFECFKTCPFVCEKSPEILTHPAP